MRLRKEQQLLNEEHLQERLGRSRIQNDLVALHFMVENRQNLIPFSFFRGICTFP